MIVKGTVSEKDEGYQEFGGRIRGHAGWEDNTRPQSSADIGKRHM